MKHSAQLLFFSLMILASSVVAEGVPSPNNKECRFVYLSPLAADTASGEIALAKQYLVIDTDNNFFDHNTDLKTCRKNKNWHCLIGGGYELYVPKPYKDSVNEWKKGRNHYKFLAPASIMIALNEIKYRPLVVYRGQEEDANIISTFLFDEEMNLIGFIDYDEFEGRQGTSTIVAYNYWLIGKKAPLNCY